MWRTRRLPGPCIVPFSPGMDLRVAPNPAPSGCADGEFPGYLESSLLRLRQWMDPRVSPNRSSRGVIRRVNLRVAPNPRSSRCTMMRLRVAPHPASSGCAEGKFPSYPESSLLRLRQRMDLRVSPTFAPSGGTVFASSGFPDSCIYGWSDDDSPTFSNLASSAKPRMNLRIQPGLAHSCLTLDAFSVSTLPSTCRTSRLINLRVQSNPASSCQTRTAFPIPYRVTSWIGVCVRSTCGSKCKKRMNLWISPRLVHKSKPSGAQAEFSPKQAQCRQS
jgi:hypothetical protein